jgi:hypothetical protein
MFSVSGAGTEMEATKLSCGFKPETNSLIEIFLRFVIMAAKVDDSGRIKKLRNVFSKFI